MPKIIATKPDWISLGYQVFAESGIQGIIVEKMASQLKVNKSSFYWHFKTKKEFIDSIISYWIESETNKVIESVDEMETGIDKLEQLIVASFKQEKHIDFIFYLKKYAVKNNDIQNLIDDIDNQRIAYIKSILMEMNISAVDAEIKSILFYQYLIGYHEMIRYKKQSKNYVTEVKQVLKQFIKFKNYEK